MGIAILRIVALFAWFYGGWRKLRNDYSRDKILLFLWSGMLMFLVASRLATINVYYEGFGALPLVWRFGGENWLVGYGTFLGLSYYLCLQNGWKLVAFLEDISGVGVVFFIFMFGDRFLRTGGGVEKLVPAVILLGIWIINLWLVRKYRSYSWYRSGKKGFIFLWSNAVFYLIYAAYSYFVGRGLVWVFIYLLIGILMLVGLFILGQVGEGLMVYFRRKK